MAVTAEVACVLTVSERSAAALLADSTTLTEGLPLTLAALGAGTISWQHARVMCDETSGLDPAAAAARALQGPAEARTLTQLRADVATSWLLGGVVEGTPSPRAQVLVTVPVFSLLGVANEPATLDGYGPIPASMARRLVADGATSLMRVLTDPRSGAPLEIGRTSYPVPNAMRQWLRLRDGRCPFPGCNNHSLDNEADHLLAWSDGGGTGISNLGQPCRKHHRLKHSSRWKPVGATKDQPPGWISPSGRSYPSEQQDWEPPHWPDHPGIAGEDGEDPEREPPTGPDALTGAAGPGETEPPLPVDPFPDWALFIAA
jgi:hypothetical protein